MTAFLASVGLPEIVAGVMMLALNAYALSGGADFGGGVWDLLARGPRREAQRTLIASAIGPIWEANHVWLIIVVVMLFTGFPSAFASLGIVLHIPLSLMLVGIVLRGAAFVFRSYGSGDHAGRRAWGRVFAIASTMTPLLLGAIIGAIASGAVGDAAARIPTRESAAIASSQMSVLDMFVAPSRTEGLGLALIEALATGLPAVAARVGGIPEVMGDAACGRLVAPNDPAALGAALRVVLGDTALRASMAVAAVERAQAFSVEASRGALARLYAGLLEPAAQAA